MYSNAFCKVYNEFGWNYFPEAFAAQLLRWLEKNQIVVKNSLDLACGTGILCQILHEHGIHASGMDFSQGMIDIARERSPQIDFEVADMILYRPAKYFDLVTCTGDALNHIIDLKDVEQIFQNVYGYLNHGGYFIFDILNKNNVSPEEAIDLDFSEEVKAKFQVTQEEEGTVNLKTAVYENGEFQFEETITEIVHDPKVICTLLRQSGFQVLSCADTLIDDGKEHGTTWFIIAQKQ